MNQTERTAEFEIRGEVYSTGDHLAAIALKISFRDIETLLAIVDFDRENDWMPSMKELGLELGRGTTSIKSRLNRLQEFGLIERNAKEAKMKVTPLGKYMHSLIDQIDKSSTSDSTS